ncbi:MAG TPA: type IV toxin-antitoxin system AbiEi family antitoxin domain-containing protein [Bdellovibrionales bacterium]|nr:type IV toxin-antitoxin system AbiEi family antitoxin domain-containing protein [Bdellovibrionales bacterium]
MRDLPTKFQNKTFTTSQFLEAGFSFYHLKQLVEAGAVEQISRGVYHSAGIDLNEEELFRVATLRVGKPSAICLLSALSFHHLTDLIPKKTWIMVPQSKRTQDKKLQLYRSVYPFWKIGVEHHDGYSVTNLERTIVECLTSRFRHGERPGIEALRSALEAKKTTIAKLTDMAEKLDVLHRLLPYIKVLT